MATAARLTALAAAALLAGSAAAGTASGRNSGIGFTLLPNHVVQGEDARVSVSVRPAGARCTLAVTYQGGGKQAGLAAVTALSGRAAWTWRVPADVQAGPARTTVRCGRAGTTTRSIVIVGRLIQDKITVGKEGFSTKPTTGGGTRLSYGIILHNSSPSKDALKVTVQTNFVMGDNNLLGTDTQRVDAIGAGSDYALGRMINFPGAAPITRLEVVVRVESFGPHSTHQPTLANIHLVPQTFDPKWLGSVEGELQNTDPAWTLHSANLSAVVFDASGNVLGGGSGFAFQSLQPGVREFIKLSNGFDAIPMDRASSMQVSVTSSWQQPGP